MTIEALGFAGGGWETSCEKALPKRTVKLATNAPVMQ